MKLTSFLLAMTVVASGANAQPATAPASRPVSEDVEEVRLSAGRLDEYDGLVADLKLEGEQLETFRAVNAERIAALQTFIDSRDGKELVALREQLAAARREKRSQDIEPLRSKIVPLSDNYWAVRNHGRRELLKTLTEPQLRQYVGMTLYQRVTRPLARLELTADQHRRIRELCDAAASGWFRMEMIDADPYFRELTPLEEPMRRRVVSEVVTDEQRARARDAAATRRATTRPAI